MEQTPKAPRVFISHSSADKESFVVPFAERLRMKGIEAWLDKWEILPGDSLVEKIFDEGIKGADVFLIVVTVNSIQSAWVREELNTGIVNRIAKKCKIIPVVVGRCEVPECLKALVWQPITPGDWDGEAMLRIVNAIYGARPKPPLGPPPAHVTDLSLITLKGINEQDSRVLTILCQAAEVEGGPLVTDLTCLDRLLDGGLTPHELETSLLILRQLGYISASLMSGGTYLDTGFSTVKLALSTFDAFARVRWPEYDVWFSSFRAGIVNEEWDKPEDIQSHPAPDVLKMHFLRRLRDDGLIRMHWLMGGGFVITGYSPLLKRELEG